MGPHDHLCWRYDESAELRPRVQEFLNEGLAIGERVCYAGTAPVEDLVDELRTFRGLPEALDRGAAQVITLAAAGATIEPAARVRAYADATAAALAAGFTGLRLVAESTPLVRTAAQLDAFARCEHLIDQYLAGHPFSAMCVYNGGELADGVIAQLACLHPTSNQDNVGFHLHASTAADYSGTLTGELDLSTADLFTTALARTALPLRDQELIVDARALDFIDHRSLLRLFEHARRRAAPLVLHVSRTGPARIVKVLDVADVRVELHQERVA
ncbi:MEDS domain-containing protein [Actinophytocola sediminis]